MYLLPESRGIGLGWRLLDTCAESGRRMGYRAFYLETMESMSQAIRLYERYGFRRSMERLGSTGHDHATAWFFLDFHGDVTNP
jgi:putative acetyltransferase